LFVVLSESQDWSSYYEKFSSLDVYYSKEYVSLASVQEPGSVPMAIYFEVSDARVWYPFLLRPVPGWSGVTDIITAYGYGGPHLEGNKERINEFYREFVSGFCLDANIVTETIRLHPLTQNHLLVGHVMDVMPVRKTIAVDLTPSYEEIVANFTYSRRTNIRKAKEKYYFEFCEGSGAGEIDTFLNLYNSTMNRNHALSQYYFDKEYFVKLMKETYLCKPQMVFLTYQGEAICGQVNLIGHQFAHGHLTGSNFDYFHMRPNEVLIDHTIKRMKQEKAVLFHLGGGYKNDDGIFKFKESFSKNSKYVFYIGKQVLNEPIYKDILASLSIDPSDYPDYFPSYRHPSIIKIQDDQ
jgi:hypothetical protein